MICRCLSGFAASCLLITTFSGCGYRVGSIGGAPLENIKTIHVPVAVNDTYEPGLGPLVTDAVIQRLMRDGTLRPTHKSAADAELLIRLRDASRRPLRSTLADERRTAEYELRVVAEISLTHLSDGNIPIKDNRLSGRTEYFVGQDLQEGERQAIGLLADDLARQIVHSLVEGW